jgi:hypothetical protein
MASASRLETYSEAAAKAVECLDGRQPLSRSSMETGLMILKDEFRGIFEQDCIHIAPIRGTPRLDQLVAKYRRLRSNTNVKPKHVVYILRPMFYHWVVVWFDRGSRKLWYFDTLHSTEDMLKGEGSHRSRRRTYVMKAVRYSLCANGIRPVDRICTVMEASCALQEDTDKWSSGLRCLQWLQDMIVARGNASAVEPFDAEDAEDQTWLFWRSRFEDIKAGRYST